MDFRTQLYDRYVSGFKSENAALTPAELRHYYEWCDVRYYPNLRNLSHSAAILELGCGHGRILSYLRAKGFTNAKGIDISQEQIDLARREGLNAECTDVFEYLDHNSPLVDCVFAVDFIEHFTKEELLRLFESLHAAMKPGATVLLQTPNGEGLFARQVMYGDLTHQTILTPGSLKQLFAMTGFKDIHCYEAGPIAKGFVGTLRNAGWKIVCSAANMIRRIESNKSQRMWTENFISVARA